MDEYLQKYILGELDQSQQSELLEQLKTDELLRKRFYELQNLHALAGLSDHPDDEAKGREDYSEFRGKLRKRAIRKRMLQIGSCAAAVALLIISTWQLASLHYQKTLPVSTNTLHVPQGQRACLTMQDGSKVWLNAQSTLVYPSHFFGADRRVSLTGEAFFEVAKDTLRPFIVSTQQVDINVLGTTFNVYSYPETQFVEASLIEGSVNVSLREKPYGSITLSPNEQVHVENGRMQVRTIDHYSYFLWKEGIYSFENESFKNIIAKLELYYDVKVIVKDPTILNFVYTGKFRQRDGIDEILRIIQKIHQFKIAKNEDRSVITLSR